MIMRLPNVGSQYLIGFLDSERQAFDGAKTYKVTLPPEHPGGEVLVASRSTTTRPARCCRRRSASRAPAARAIPVPPPRPNADGSTTVYFGPNKPDGVKRRQLDPDDARQRLVLILRLYSPLEPFFDKSWRPSEIEPVAN